VSLSPPFPPPPVTAPARTRNARLRELRISGHHFPKPTAPPAHIRAARVALACLRGVADGVAFVGVVGAVLVIPPELWRMVGGVL
jgi:hypothetical protein